MELVRIFDHSLVPVGSKDVVLDDTQVCIEDPGSDLVRALDCFGELRTKEVPPPSSEAGDHAL